MHQLSLFDLVTPSLAVSALVHHQLYLELPSNALMSLRPLAGDFAKSFSLRFNVRVSDQGLDQPS